MKDIRIISGKRITPSIDTVAALCGVKLPGTSDSEVQRIFRQQLPSVLMHLRPKAALSIGSVRLPLCSRRQQAEKDALFAMLTIGGGVSRMIQKAMDKQDMLQAFVLDAMADSCLYTFEEQLLPSVRQICLEEGFGVMRRLELMSDVPESMLKIIYETVDAGRTLGISMTSGFMLTPEKSMSLLFELTDDTDMQRLEHNCSTCLAEDCALRKTNDLQITVEVALPFQHSEGGACQSNAVSRQQFSCSKGSILLDVLHENGIFPPAYCGKQGVCGKCGVQIVEGFLPITPEDQAVFSPLELQNGMRLSCKAALQGNVTACVHLEKEDTFQVLGCHGKDLVSVAKAPAPEKCFGEKSLTDQDNRFGVAIDIGTTTLAFSLVQLAGGRVIDTYTAVNSQRPLGADVLSRMQAANAGKSKQLRVLAQKDILHGLQTLLKRNCLYPALLSEIVIAANTVMLHLLRGYSCEGLSRHPFTPVTLNMEELSLSELFAGLPQGISLPCAQEQIKATLLPGISAFVGADITAGLYACGILDTKDNVLFLDLGTNGEMALKKGSTIYTASTAAGPAFEAANIKWGMPGIAGAISQVQICKGEPRIKTIGDCQPAGICGTGVVETIAGLLEDKLMDSTGKLKEPYFSQGYPLGKTIHGETIALLQKDIREIQMAKAAIRSGMETLLIHSGTHWDEIGKIYLAGGFGYFLDITKAAAIGILPKEAAKKTKAAGNTALEGALLYLKTKNHSTLQDIIKNARGISLAEDEKFQELYLEHLSF